MLSTVCQYIFAISYCFQDNWVKVAKRLILADLQIWTFSVHQDSMGFVLNDSLLEGEQMLLQAIFYSIDSFFFIKGVVGLKL